MDLTVTKSYCNYGGRPLISLSGSVPLFEVVNSGMRMSHDVPVAMDTRVKLSLNLRCFEVQEVFSSSASYSCLWFVCWVKNSLHTIEMCQMGQSSLLCLMLARYVEILCVHTMFTVRQRAVQCVHLYLEIEWACGTVCIHKLSDRTAGEFKH